MDITRRQAITYLTVPVLQLLLPGLKDILATPTTTRPRTILWIWPDGGPPQTDMFDPKPEAPDSIRGDFRAINVPGLGIQVSELFPEIASVLRYTTIFRARRARSLDHLAAMASTIDRHGTGQHLLTRLARQTGGMPFIYAESPGVIRAFNYRHDAFSTHLSMEISWDDHRRSYIPPAIRRVTSRDRHRRALLSKLDRTSPLSGPGVNAHAGMMDRAYTLMERGLNVALPPALIRRYGGANQTSLGILTMRELARQGVSGALLFRDGDWDYHSDVTASMRQRGPRLDKALAELIKDARRGDLGDVVIVFAAEFGRTPELSGLTRAGRDHFPFHTAFVCGGAMREGLVHGRTDGRGRGVAGIVDDSVFVRVLEQAVAREPNFAARSDLPRVFR